MNRILINSLVLFAVLLSCNNSEKSNNKLEIAEHYFAALDSSNSAELKDLLSDSIVSTIPKYDYEVRYYSTDYLEKWLKWDSVFNPTYEVIDMTLENGTVKAKVSKTDKRIDFLMQQPFLTNEILRFDNHKIVSVETEYLNFDDVMWEKNKNGLLEWTEENYPELDLKRSIYDQTESGGMKLLKAIELYQSRK